MENQGIELRAAALSDIDALTLLAAQVQTVHAQGRPDLFRPAEMGALRDFLIARLSDDSVLLVAEDHRLNRPRFSAATLWVQALG